MGFRKRLADIVVVRGDFILRSGKDSDYIINLPLVQSDSAVFEWLIRKTKKVIDSRTEAIAGCLTGGALIGSALAYEMRLPFFAVNPDNKTIIGSIPRVYHITLLDDVITTGGALRDATDVLRNNGYFEEIYYTVAVNRGDDEITCNNRRVSYAINAKELLNSPSVKIKLP